MTWSTERDFNALDEAGWNDGEAGPPEVPCPPEGCRTIQSDATAPISPNNVYQVFFPNGCCDGSDPGIGEIFPPTQLDEVYLEYYTKFMPGFYGHTSGANNHKNSFFWFWDNNQGNPTRTFFTTVTECPEFTDGCRPRAICNGCSDECGGARNFDHNVSVVEVNKGDWFHVEYRMVMNTPGLADGILQLWVNGTQAMDYADVCYAGAGADADSYWYWIQIAPTFGGVGLTVPQDQWMRWDYYYASGK